MDMIWAGAGKTNFIKINIRGKKAYSRRDEGKPRNRFKRARRRVGSLAPAGRHRTRRMEGRGDIRGKPETSELGMKRKRAKQQRGK